ncbi:hypothetical protein CspeluHIS016_0504690 [Cutaneotrichosporon spelunceum]|uniref:Ras GEF n=1 Tax=Cutaneotrichosporon spelunceum TaxID=1672016 RepID=A0AAD3TXX2_9TREE|nr:hypothetical protein CspeluHIS016_0504690 [Cutaneotrichosporon spelunceum]
MPSDSRVSATSVLSPPSSGIDALGILDLGTSSPASASASGASRGTNAHHLASQTSSSSSASTFHADPLRGHTAAAYQYPQPNRNPYTQPYPGEYSSTTDADLSAEALGLPPDTEISRIGEGESYRVRAVYDFDATDESALSFRAGDVIEVLTMLPSGWWDGMLGANRGWFPSNYVEDYYDDDDSRYGDYVEMAPDGSIQIRNGSSVADLLGVDDSLAAGWGGRDWVGSSSSLDDLLALERMDEQTAHHLLHRRRTDSRASQSSRSAGRVGPAAVTAGARRSGGDDDHSHDDPDETLQQASQTRGHRDAWVPTLTADGQVYYHNTTTGEDAWYIPEGVDELGMSRPASQASSQPRDDPGHGRVHPLKLDSRDLRSHSSYDRAARSAAAALSWTDDFRVPATRQAPLQYPWLARLTDDGRSWYYLNQVTGEMTREPPSQMPTTASTTENGQGGTASLRRPSVSTIGSTTLSVARPPRRSSLRHSQLDLEHRIHSALAALYHTPPQPMLNANIDKLRNSINNLYEAAMTGADVQTEKDEALQAHVGMQQALAKDYATCAALNECERCVVDATRELFLALGYVGPTIPSPRGQDSGFTDDLPRPQWCTDMSLVGVLGLIASTVRVATEGSRDGASSRIPWDNVMRAAAKMRATLEAFPAIVHMDPTERESTVGRHLVAWFGAEYVGDFMSGRFGFGAPTDILLRPLDQAAVVEVQKLKAEVDAALRAAVAQTGGAVFDLIRSSSYFSDAVARIDVAIVIDLDGDKDNTSEVLHPEETRHYAELVSRARSSLRDLDDACRSLYTAAADVFLNIDDPGSLSSRELVGQGVSTVFRALSSLLVVAQQQAATVEQGVVKGLIGGRSPAKTLSAIHTRGASSTSAESPSHNRVQSQHKRNASGGSVESRATRTTGGSAEQEFLDNDDRRSITDRASKRLSRQSQQSASASQTSLVKPQGPSSSKTSLGDQPDSEAGSMRGSNRSSILKAVPSFLRTGRSDSVSQGKPSKKYPRIKEDRSSMILTHPPPAPMSAPPAAAMRAAPPWYLSSDYLPGDIVFDEEKGTVKAGTIRALIERLTPHTSSDTAFFQAFLLTYRSFVSTDNLVELLLERYHVEPPTDLSEEQMKEWKMRKQTPIRLRVANTLKTWLEHHYIEEQDRNALDVVEDFATTTLMANGSELLSKQLLQLVDRRRRGEATAKSRIVMGGPAPQPPIQPRVLPGKPLTLLDIQPLELARQLTIIESGHFVKIRPPEFLNKTWQKEDSDVTAPNLSKAISSSNALSLLIQKIIVQTKDVKQRAAIIKHLVRTCVECKELNNFSSMSAVCAGLVASSVQRLRKSWEPQSEKTMRDFAMLEELMSSTRNFQKHKEMLKTINPPCVPFLGFYLSMLVFIEDGNRDFVPQPVVDANGNVVRSTGMGRTASMTSGITRAGSASSGMDGMLGRSGSMAPSMTSISTTVSNGVAPSNSSTLVASTSSATSNGGEKERPMLINFFKRGLTAEILREIQQYQAQPYNLALCKPVMDFIEEQLAGVTESVDELYEISLATEPKERSQVLADERAMSAMGMGRV